MGQNKSYLKPGFFLSKIINPLLITFGLISYLKVKGRMSGKWISTPITPIEYKGNIYLVSPRGETQWVRNLRAEANAQITMKGKTRKILASEVAGKLQEEVINEYRQKNKMVDSFFIKLPKTSEHPTFRIQ